MSGTNFFDTPPPEVPEEFGDAYREAYLKAYAEAQAEFPGEIPPLGELHDSAELSAMGLDPADELADEPAYQPPVDEDRADEGTQVMQIGTHRATPTAEASAPVFEAFRASAWFIPALIAVAALALILVAYVLGRVLGGDDAGKKTPTVSATTSAPTTGQTNQPRKTQTAKPVANAYAGDLTPTTIASATATCTAPPGVDSSGNKVTYGVGHAIDDQTDTAWRCDGSAVGQKIVLDLGSSQPIGEVGLVPGYAKTDSESHVDRYAQNNRITKVRWTFDDGSSVVQNLSGNPTDRSLQAVRVPKTDSATVTLQILAVTNGPRNTTAISDVQFSVAD